MSSDIDFARPRICCFQLYNGVSDSSRNDRYSALLQLQRSKRYHRRSVGTLRYLPNAYLPPPHIKDRLREFIIAGFIRKMKETKENFNLSIVILWNSISRSIKVKISKNIFKLISLLRIIILYTAFLLRTNFSKLSFLHHTHTRTTIMTVIPRIIAALFSSSAGYLFLWDILWFPPLVSFPSIDRHRLNFRGCQTFLNF